MESKLADRLRGILKPANSPAPAASGSCRTIRGDALETVLGGEWRGTDRGAFVVERRADATTFCGREPIGAVAAQLQAAGAEASLIAGGAPATPPFVFFDLETTGLSGGAGTYAFLVGCGWFDGAGAFVTRQSLLARLADERPFLELVAADLARAGALVSFNGKSFDAPLLETRYAYHRLAWLAARLPHVDVLHPARRFWKPPDRDAARRDTENTCSLLALEREVLGTRRVGDVPGFEIPGRYFQFVRTGDPRPLAAVLEHNRRDLLSLAGLTARLLSLIRSGPEHARDAREALALGHVYVQGGLDVRARHAYTRAIAMAAGPTGAFDPMRIEGLRGLAVMERRARRFEESAACWRRLLDVHGCPHRVAHEATEALAIHHEHRVRDLAAAKAFALRCLDYAGHPARHESVRYRVARIEKKMNAARVNDRRAPPLSLLFTEWAPRPD